MRNFGFFQAKFIAIDIFSGSDSIICRKRLSARGLYTTLSGKSFFVFVNVFQRETQKVDIFDYYAYPP